MLCHVSRCCHLASPAPCHALLHNFFSGARLEIEITDRFGKKVKPREWFLLPVEVIAEAISRLQDGSIVDYRFDSDTATIVQLKG